MVHFNIYYTCKFVIKAGYICKHRSLIFKNDSDTVIHENQFEKITWNSSYGQGKILHTVVKIGENSF